MAGDIEKFDPSKLTDKLRERINVSISELVPKEVWDEMMGKQIKAFFEPTHHPVAWNKPSTPSVFESAVVDCLKAEATRMVQAQFQSEEWRSKFDNTGKQVASAFIEELVLKNSAVLVQGLLADAMQKFLQDLQYRVRG